METATSSVRWNPTPAVVGPKFGIMLKRVETGVWFNRTIFAEPDAESSADGP
jgi:hypothetical protein